MKNTEKYEWHIIRHFYDTEFGGKEGAEERADKYIKEHIEYWKGSVKEDDLKKTYDPKGATDWKGVWNIYKKERVYEPVVIDIPKKNIVDVVKVIEPVDGNKNFGIDNMISNLKNQGISIRFEDEKGRESDFSNATTYYIFSFDRALHINGSMPKREPFSEEYVLRKIAEKEKYEYIDYSKVFKNLNLPNVGYYTTTYGVGVEVIFGNKEKTIKIISDYLKENGIEFTNQYSDAGWAYRFKISKSKSNLDKIKSLIENKEEMKKLTTKETIDKGYKFLKEKLGDKKTDKYFKQVDALINPFSNHIIEYRENGVVILEDGKYIFNALSDMDFPKWRLSFKSDISDQFDSDLNEYKKDKGNYDKFKQLSKGKDWEITDNISDYVFNYFNSITKDDHPLILPISIDQNGDYNVAVGFINNEVIVIGDRDNSKVKYGNKVFKSVEEAIIYLDELVEIHDNKEEMTKHLDYKEAIKLPKGGAVKMDKDNFTAQAAEMISSKQGTRPEAIYNWANKHNVDISKYGYILSDIKSNDELLEDVLNDKFDAVKTLVDKVESERKNKKEEKSNCKVGEVSIDKSLVVNGKYVESKSVVFKSFDSPFKLKEYLNSTSNEKKSMSSSNNVGSSKLNFSIPQWHYDEHGNKLYFEYDEKSDCPYRFINIEQTDKFIKNSDNINILTRKEKRDEISNEYGLTNKEVNEFMRISSVIKSFNQPTKVYSLDKSVSNKLVEKGLLKKENDEYDLTEKGKLISDDYFGINDSEVKEVDEVIENPYAPQSKFNSGDLVKFNTSNIDDSSVDVDNIKIEYNTHYGYIVKPNKYVIDSTRWKPHWTYDVKDFYDGDIVYKDVMEGRISLTDADKIQHEVDEVKTEEGTAELLTKAEADKLSEKYIELLKGEYNQKNETLHDWFGEVICRYPKLLTEWQSIQLDFIPKKEQELLEYLYNDGLPNLKQFFNSLMKYNVGKKELIGIYELISERLVNDKLPKKVDFKLDPTDKGLSDIFKKIVSDDDLRPLLTGIEFDDYGVVGTDAHKLLFISGKATKKGTFNIGKQIGTKIDGKYPLYQRVIPIQVIDGSIVMLDRKKVELMYSSLKTIKNAKCYNVNTGAFSFSLYKGEGTWYNIENVIYLLEAWLKVGFDKLEFSYKTKTNGQNNVLVIAPNIKEFTKFKGSGSIVMAIMKGSQLDDMSTQSPILQTELYMDVASGKAETAGITDDLYSEFNLALGTEGAIEEKEQIGELESLIELLKEVVSENPKDEDSKDALELYEETLVELKKVNADKFAKGGKVGCGCQHSFEKGGSIESELDAMYNHIGSKKPKEIIVESKGQKIKYNYALKSNPTYYVLDKRTYHEDNEDHEGWEFVSSYGSPNEWDVKHAFRWEMNNVSDILNYEKGGSIKIKKEGTLSSGDHIQYEVDVHEINPKFNHKLYGTIEKIDDNEYFATYLNEIHFENEQEKEFDSFESAEKWVLSKINKDKDYYIKEFGNKFENGGELESFIKLSKQNYDNLVNSNEFNIVKDNSYGIDVYQIKEIGSNKVLGKFKELTEALWLTNDRTLSNPLVVYLRENSILSADNIELLEKGGEVGYKPLYYATYNDNNIGLLLLDTNGNMAFEILHASVLRGSSYSSLGNNIPISGYNLKNIKKASEKDFDIYRVSLPSDFNKLNNPANLKEMINKGDIVTFKCGENDTECRGEILDVISKDEFLVSKGIKSIMVSKDKIVGIAPAKINTIFERDLSIYDERVMSINSTLFYLSYEVGTNPFEVIYDDSNEYGYGIYLCDSKDSGRIKITENSRIIKLLPNVKKPLIFLNDDGSSFNSQYKDAYDSAVKYDGVKSKDEFSRKMVELGYDSMLVSDVHGTHLVLLYNDLTLYIIKSDTGI